MFACEMYVSALVGVIIKVILQNARCNNKEVHSCLPLRPDQVLVLLSKLQSFSWGFVVTLMSFFHLASSLLQIRVLIRFHPNILLCFFLA